MMKVLSVDAETNGLMGQPFAVGAVYTDSDGHAETYVDRCGVVGEIDPWVLANVIPALDGIDYPPGRRYVEMLADFAAWFDARKDGARVIAHVAWPVEARLFTDMIGLLDRDPFSGPFPLHDLATLLYSRGWASISADAYIQDQGLAVPLAEGLSPHNPLYDAAVAEVAWRSLLRNGGA